MSKENVVTLKVAASTTTAKLATSIMKHIQEGKTVETLSIGAGATHQAIKGIIVARGYVASGGMDLTVKPGFIDLTINNEAKTAMKFQILVDA